MGGSPYAAEHPAQSFPTQLSDIKACPPSRNVRAKRVYRPAPPNVEGRVVRYEATWDEGWRSFFTDETGVLRMARGPGRHRGGPDVRGSPARTLTGPPRIP